MLLFNQSYLFTYFTHSKIATPLHAAHPYWDNLSDIHGNGIALSRACHFFFKGLTTKFLKRITV